MQKYQAVPDLEVQRIEVMNAVRYGIEALMKPMTKVAFKGLSCRTRDEEYVRLNFADIVEVKDMIHIKYGHRTADQCMKFHINCNKMNLPSTYLFRTKEETDELLGNGNSLNEEDGGLTWRIQEEARNLRIEAKTLLDRTSLHNMLHVLIDFSFVGSTHLLDIYKVLTVEPLHLFHLGMSHMLKQCM